MIDILCIIDTGMGMLRHGKLHRFRIAGGPSSARLAEKTLRRYGVPIYGRANLPNNGRTFLVPVPQIRFAEYLICSAGMPIMDKLIYPRNAGYAPPKSAWGVPARSGIGGWIAKRLGV